MMGSYKLSNHMLGACRALNKLLVIVSIPDWVIVSETSYDGGEWSGPILDRLQTEIQDKATTTVALRFGYMPHQLFEAFEYYYHTETEIMLDSFPHLGCYK